MSKSPKLVASSSNDKLICTDVQTLEILKCTCIEILNKNPCYKLLLRSNIRNKWYNQEDWKPDLFVTFLVCSELTHTCNLNNLFHTLTVVCVLQGAAYLVSLNSTLVPIKCNQIQDNIYQERMKWKLQLGTHFTAICDVAAVLTVFQYVALVPRNWKLCLLFFCCSSSRNKYITSR